MHIPWAYPSLHPKRHVDRDRFSLLYSSRYSNPALYNGPPLFLLKIAPSLGLSAPSGPLNFLVPTRVTISSSIAISSAVLQGSRT